MYYVILIKNGLAKSVACFPCVPGFIPKIAAENYAQELCYLNHVIYDGNISVNSDENIIVQILNQE